MAWTVAWFASKRPSTKMTDNHTFPVMANVEQVRDYLDWLVKIGKGSYRLELRERYIATPPSVESNSFDDQAKVAFLIGVH